MFVQTKDGVAMDGKGMRQVVELADARYPPSLKDLEKPPERLYVIGDASVLSRDCLAVIGARKATPYGLAVAEMAGRIAAECGVVLVSGGAIGCDAAALRGAQQAGGVTVVVPGSGADHVYPKSSRDVFRGAVEGGGCVASLMAWGSPPMQYSFVKRNAIIAALGKALLVCEAGERSGTSSTADYAASLGRQVYAVPGSIFSPESVGANRLIGLGAAPIVSQEDLEVRLSMDFGAVRLVAGSARRDLGRIMSALMASPMRPDDLANHLQEETLSVLLALSDFEASGAVTRLPDGRYAPSVKTFLGK